MYTIVQLPGLAALVRVMGGATAWQQECCRLHMVCISARRLVLLFAMSEEGVSE